MMGESALVVFSGGQDSTTCLYWAKKNFRKVFALSFIYGQKHVKEVELAKELAKEAGVEWDCMDVSFISGLVADRGGETCRRPSLYLCART